MGGSNSKRTLIVENEDGGSIKITEGVVRRLKGLPDEDKKETDKSGVPQPAATPAPAAPVSPAPTPAPAPAPKVQEPPKDPDYSQYGLYPKKVNAELEDLYVKKLKDLQDKHAELNKKTNEQFAQAVQEVEGKFLDYTAVPVCQDLQSALLQCYQANPHEILKCSSVVNAFSVCVERARITASSTRVQSERSTQQVIEVS